MNKKFLIAAAIWSIFVLYPSIIFPLDVGFTTSLNKVFFEAPTDFAGTITSETQINVAGNEYEATQMILFPKENISGVTVGVSDLTRTGGSEIIPASDITISPVAYVNLTEAKVAGDRTGWIPDPLLPNGPLNLSNGVLQPYLITVYAKSLSRSGDYAGSITVKSGSTVLATLTLKVKVYNFSLPKASKFKTVNFTSWDSLSGMWPESQGYPSLSGDQNKPHYLKLADLGFKNRIPPVAFMANGLASWNWGGTGGTSYGYPTHDGGVFNPTRTGELIDYMVSKGANHFFMGLTSDVYLYPGMTTTRLASLKKYFTDYRLYLISRGLLDMAYVYNADEPWGDAVQHAKDTYTFLKTNVGSDLRIMQNTNQDNGTILGTLLGYFDSLDINLGWYDITDSAGYRTQHPDQFQDFWWNVNIWPDVHPNLFLEYPLVDARIMGPMSFKYNMQGFEYWDVCSRYGMASYHPIDSNETRVQWDVDLHSLDGTIVYPGTNYELNSSLRYESFRDGMEDQEYLYLLKEKDPANPLLNVSVVTGLSQFEQDPTNIFAWRDSVALALSKYYPDDGSNPDTNNPDSNGNGALYSVIGGCNISPRKAHTDGFSLITLFALTLTGTLIALRKKEID